MGKEVNQKFMPWNIYGHLDEDQLKAMYAYLMKQPPLTAAVVKK